MFVRVYAHVCMYVCEIDHTCMYAIHMLIMYMNVRTPATCTIFTQVHEYMYIH